MKKLILVLGSLISISTFSQTSLESQDIIYDKVDVSAQLPGGMDAFRNKFMKTFDSNKLKSNGAFSTVITFIVDENGVLSQVLATGKDDTLNSEAIRTVKKMKTKWTPGIVNGKPVKSR
jgi:protein TonB